MLPLETQITTDRYIDPNIYATSVGSTIQLPCNTTPATGDDQVALLLFYKEDTQQISQISADKEDEKDNFSNHKARPIYSIDAREAPLHSATHFPGDSIDSDRLAIRFEPSVLNSMSSKDKNFSQQKQRKKSNRKGGRYHEDVSSEESGVKSRQLKSKGMVYLEISNVKKQDDGVYRCRVDYRRGRTINVIITLSVSVPTTRLDISDHNSILDPSSNLIKAGPYNEGTSVNLTCTSDGGVPPPTLRWYRGDRIMNSTELLSTKTDQTAIRMPLSNLERIQLNELYMCKAFTNFNHTMSLIPSLTRTISIDLNLKPKVAKIITSVDKLTPSKSLELVCQVSGFKPIAKLIWILIHDNSISLDQIDLLETFALDAFLLHNLTSKSANETFFPINLRSEYKYRLTRLPDLGASQSEDGLTLTGFISFRPTIEDNNRRLACIAFNPHFLVDNHYIHDSIVLEVKFAPKINLVMGASVQHEVILKGYDVFFQCNVQANPSVTEIGWKFNDQPLKSDERLGIQVSNTSLLLKNVYDVHSGQYLCFAKNDQGTGKSEFIQLNVQYKPYCKQTHRLYVGVSLSESVVINCEMDANPSQELQYIWTLNGIELTSQQMSSDQASMQFEANKSRLIYTPRKAEHFGQFKCIGISSLGSSDEDQSCTVNLVPAGIPDVLSNCNKFNLTQQSFTLSCLSGFNGGLEQSFHLELWIKQPDGKKENLFQDTTSNNEQSNEISPIQNLPKVSKSEDLLISLVGHVKASDKQNTSTRTNLIKDNRQTIYEVNNANYSHLLSSINLNNLTTSGHHESQLTMNNSTTDKQLVEKELRKINYGLMRKSTNKLLNMNTLNQTHTETYDRLIKRLKEAKFHLMANLTSFDYPFFSVYSLPMNAEFQLIIYASNKIGRSKELHLSGNTLLASHWQTEIVTESLPFNQSLVFVLFGVIFVVLIFSTVLFVVKFRTERNKKSDQKHHDFSDESIESLTHLSLNNTNEMALNSCAHQAKNQYQKCELAMNSHVSFEESNCVNQTLNIYPITEMNHLNPNSTIITHNEKLSTANQMFIDNYNQDLFRDIYLNQIILPHQQDLTKFQNNRLETNLIRLGDDQINTHCVLLGEIYASKLPDCCSISKVEEFTAGTSLQQSNEMCSTTSNSLSNQIKQNVTMSQLELSNLNIQSKQDCQFVYEYEDRLI